MFVLISGNIADGFKFIGPFATAEEANEYVDDLRPMQDPWWVAPMEKPELVSEPPTKTMFLVASKNGEERSLYSQLDNAEFMMTNFMEGEAELYRCELIR